MLYYIHFKFYIKSELTLSIVLSNGGTGKLGSEPWKLNNWGFLFTISLMIDWKYKKKLIIFQELQFVQN